ncbi:hypothetical protein AZE42_12749 [Rhizopogon vesiculosus]|uniref:Uncharacterized protein n=1 Tax=Rhizopogon vesiculosus TaxID=180088 RepID=A0A1J8Q2T6_9AGAM|nr:hypothetical protein AZE42_12749 [Rhizopogon vesiculosus]
MFATGECWIPGVIGYLDETESSRWTVIYSLLIVAEFEILLILVYRAVKSCGWRIENRLMRDLVQDNLLYFCCGFGWCSQISHMPPNLLSGYYSFFHLCPSHHEISSVSGSTPSSRVSGHCSDNLGHPNAQELLEIGSLFLRHLRTKYLAPDVHSSSPRSYITTTSLQTWCSLQNSDLHLS